MNTLRNTLVCFVCIALTMATGLAHACKIRRYSISDYTQGHISKPAIFHGVVVGVVEAPSIDGVSIQDIQFQVVRWFGRQSQASVTVIGSTGILRGTDCEEAFDFSAQKGEQWLIFGRLEQGKIVPDTQLSTRLIDGKIEPSVLRLIE